MAEERVQKRWKRPTYDDGFRQMSNFSKKAQIERLILLRRIARPFFARAASKQLPQVVVHAASQPHTRSDSLQNRTENRATVRRVRQAGHVLP